jgi:hypothetical protein
MNIWLRFALAALATWRVTHLLASEDGPADLVVRLRVHLGDGFAGRLLDCFYCLSLWVAAPFALFVTGEPTGWAVSWLALSGAACLLERIGAPGAIMPPASAEAKGGIDDVLRTEEIVDQVHHARSGHAAAEPALDAANPSSDGRAGGIRRGYRPTRD